MMNWHNEVHEEAGWFEELRQSKIDRGIVCGICGEWTEYCGCGTLDSQEKENGKIERYERTGPSSCSICGTRTGQHGFSFDKKRHP